MYLADFATNSINHARSLHLPKLHALARALLAAYIGPLVLAACPYYVLGLHPLRPFSQGGPGPSRSRAR